MLDDAIPLLFICSAYCKILIKFKFWKEIYAGLLTVETIIHNNFSRNIALQNEASTYLSKLFTYISYKRS